MSYTVRVLYDFEADNSDELSVNEGDIITVTDGGAGDGWVSARDQDGMQGLVPENYTEAYNPDEHREQKSFDWDDDESEEEVEPITPSAQGNVSGSRKESFSFNNQISTERNLGQDDGAMIQVNIDNVALTCSWVTPETSYSCCVGPGRKVAKYGGIRTVVTYGITPSFSNIQVSRSFHNFSWLHGCLVMKYGSVVVIPPMPEKVLYGDLEDELIEKRRVGFQKFVNRISRHPVLSISEAWNFFITETDEKKWKEGKRRVELDAQNHMRTILQSIQSSPRTQEMENALETEIMAFRHDLNKMDSSVKQLLAVANNQLRRNKNLREREMKNIGQAFCEMGFAIKEDRPIFVKIGMNYDVSCKLWNSHIIEEWKPLFELLLEYRALLSGWHHLLDTYYSVKDKYLNGKIPEMVSSDLFVMYKVAINAERCYFKSEQLEEFSNVNKLLMEEGIRFYKQLTEKLESVHNNCWPQ